MIILVKNREAFSGFDPNIVAKMGEKEITEIASNKAIMLAESRVRCIVENAKCILKASSPCKFNLDPKKGSSCCAFLL